MSAELDGNAVATLINRYRIEAETSIAAVQASLNARKDDLAAVVAGWRSVMFDVGARLARAHAAFVTALARDPNNPKLRTTVGRVSELLEMWAALAQGYAAYERPATETEQTRAVRVGVAPAVVLIVAIAGVATVALSITGVCWAVVHFEKAKALRDEIEAIERDPTLAPLLTRINETQPGAAPETKGGGGGALVLGGLAAVGLLGAIVWFTRK